MSSLISFKAKGEKKINFDIQNYLNSDFVYIPLSSNSLLKVKQNDLILKNQLIVENNQLKVYSPVSGKVIGAKKMLDANGITHNCLVVENDFREKSVRKSPPKEISSYNIKDAHGVLGDSGLDINPDFENFESLVINCMETQIQMDRQLIILSENTYEILETIDALSEVFKIPNVYLIIKNNDSDSITKVINYLGTFPKINLRLIPDLYPMETKEVLLNYLKLKEVLVLSGSQILEIGRILKYKSKKIEEYIFIGGNALENSLVVNVKLGASVANMVRDLVEIKENTNCQFFVNGLLSGNKENIKDLIVTSDLRALFFENVKEYSENPCINCGSCIEVCPLKIHPKLILNKKIKSHVFDACNFCGACTYICPAKIDLKSKIKEVKK